MPSVAAHDEQRLGREPAVLEHDATTRSPLAGRRPSASGRTRDPRGRRSRRPRTGGPARGTRAAAPGRSSPPRDGRPVPAGDRDGRHQAPVRSASRRAPVGDRAAPLASGRSMPPRAAPARTAAARTPSSVTMPVISSAGVTSKAGLQTAVPGGRDAPGRGPPVPRRACRSSIGIASPSAVARSTAASGAQTKNGTPWRAASDGQRDTCPTLFAVSPLAATRSAPTRIASTSAAGHQRPGGDVRDQRVRHAGLGELPGRQAGALEVRPRLVDPDVDRPLGVVGRLDDAERGPELAAGERPGVAVGQDLERTPVRLGQRGQAELREPAVVLGRLGHDPRRPRRGSPRRAVARPVLELAVARSAPSADRPPSARLTAVGPGVDAARCAAPRRIARRAYGWRSREPRPRWRGPTAATWPMAGAPRTTIVLDRAGAVAAASGPRARRARPAGGAGRRGAGRRPSSKRNGVRKPVGAARADAASRAGQAEPRARRPFVATAPRRRRVADRLGLCGRPIPDAPRRPRPLGRARDDLAGELAEEPPPGADRGVSRSWRRGGHRRWTRGRRSGQYRMTLVTRRPSSRSRPLRNSSSTRKARPTTSPLRRSTSSIVPLTVPPVASRSSTIEHLLAGLDRVAVDLEGVGAVLEGVLDGQRLGRELAELADRDEARAELDRHRRAEDEAARLHADDDVDLLAPVGLEHEVDRLAVRGRILQQRRDVVEQDPRLREVRDLADLLAKRLGGHRFGVLLVSAAIGAKWPAARPTRV